MPGTGAGIAALATGTKLGKAGAVAKGLAATKAGKAVAAAGKVDGKEGLHKVQQRVQLLTWF